MSKRIKKFFFLHMMSYIAEKAHPVVFFFFFLTIIVPY